jgi:hypothetical protein
MSVELHEISENFIAELWKVHKNHNEVFDHLPEYCLRADGHLSRADEYLQFIGIEEVREPQKIIFVNIYPVDHQLDYEFGESGIAELFNEINFKALLDKTPFKPEPEENLSKFVFPTTNIMIVELCYSSSFDYYNGADDWEMEPGIVGFLNPNTFSPQYFE